jgi:methylated-DNA-[protein]-cysteine S-methyltransferase
MATLTMGTPAGPFTVIASGGSVLAAGFTDDAGTLLPLVHPQLRPPGGTGDADLDLIAKAVTAYFDGDVTAIDQVPVSQRTGGPFLAQAWDVLRGVPAGTQVTYREFAALTGHPGAIRAAGSACARNAAALFVPCHRVVRTDGSLGGYRWGLEVKKFLIQHERTLERVTETATGRGPNAFMNVR